MLKSIEYSFILRAKTPIAHHQGVEGTVGVLHRATTENPETGEVFDVPDVSGNCMRHGLREAIAITTLDAMGKLEAGTFDRPDSVRLLMNGGSNAGSGNTIKIDDMRAMQTLVPALALLGGTSSNQIHYGRVECGSAYLICEESLHMLETWQKEALGQRPIYSAAEQEVLIQHYSRDGADSPLGEHLLTDEAKSELLNRRKRREKATDDDDEVAASESKSTQMPHAAEAVRAGSLWMWSVVGHVFNDLEEATFSTMVASFMRRAIVGSGRRVGNGHLEVHEARGFNHLRPAEAMRVIRDPNDVLGQQQAEMYLEHVRGHSEEIMGWLKNKA